LTLPRIFVLGVFCSSKATHSPPLGLVKDFSIKEEIHMLVAQEIHTLVEEIHMLFAQEIHMRVEEIHMLVEEIHMLFAQRLGSGSRNFIPPSGQPT
jgi:hypothetical protein